MPLNLAPGTAFLSSGFDDYFQCTGLRRMAKGLIGIHDPVELDVMRDQLGRIDLGDSTVLSSIGVVAASTSRVVIAMLRSHSFSG